MGALTPEKGLLCAGCPHRGAYLAAKESVRGKRGAVVCGNVGCAAVGFMYPGAATCLGGMDRLPARYRTDRKIQILRGDTLRRVMERPQRLGKTNPIKLPEEHRCKNAQYSKGR